MTKNVLVNFFILCFISLNIISCREELPLIENQSDSKNEISIGKFKIKHLTDEQFQKIPEIKQKLIEFQNKIQNPDTLGKSIYNETYDFTIQTEEVSEVENDGKISYTFLITRENPIEGISLENLLMYNENGIYKFSLIQYNVPQEEITNYFNGYQINLKDKIITIELNPDNIILSKIVPCLVTKYLWISTSSNYNGLHSPFQGAYWSSSHNSYGYYQAISEMGYCEDGSTGFTGGGGSTIPTTGSNQGAGPQNYLLGNKLLNLMYPITYDTEINAKKTWIRSNEDFRDFLVYYYHDLNQQSQDALNFCKWICDFAYDNRDSIALEKIDNWINWYLSFQLSNVNAKEYFSQHPNDLEMIFNSDIDYTNSEDMSAANSVANVITDILINEQNGTIGNLSSNWIGLDALKQKVQSWISKGVYTTARYSRDYLVVPLSKYANNNPTKIAWLNTYVIDKIRNEAVVPLVNFNENTMSWGDLFNIWLFELTPGNYSNNTINFTNSSNVINGNNLYNPSTNAVKNFPKGNNTPGGTLLNIQSKLANGLEVGQTTSGYFKYDVNAFYSTLSNVNIGIQMLGSFPITATVISKSTNTAVVRFHISNDLGWESGTRFIKGTNGSGNQGVLSNKPVGSGLHLGGTITNNFTWTETINF